jgi:uncharacterized protein YdeI (YjbR/CyaY-like superfamily)
MEKFRDIPVLLVESASEWQKWLDKNKALDSGVWLKIAKKNSGTTSISYEDALQVALCYGWIDGQVYKYDEKYYIQKFTPRRAKSIWSKKNVLKAEELIKAGKMQPSGLEVIKQAKANGRWDTAYPSSSDFEIPADFQAALNKNLVAKEFYETLTKTNRYGICFRIQTAVKPETRQAQITKFIDMLEKGQKLHP